MVPGYPAIPVTAFISSALLLLVLITSIERRSWNFGLTILCFSVFIENFFGAIETIIWKDNADIKFLAFCDFSKSIDALLGNEMAENRLVSRWQMFTSIVKPASTLVITRSLYRIASMQTIPHTTQEARYLHYY